MTTAVAAKKPTQRRGLASFFPILAWLPRYDRSWLRPDIIAGTIGSDARALGGALMPLYANFAPDREVFLKLEA